MMCRRTIIMLGWSKCQIARKLGVEDLRCDSCAIAAPMPFSTPVPILASLRSTDARDGRPKCDAIVIVKRDRLRLAVEVVNTSERKSNETLGSNSLPAIFFSRAIGFDFLRCFSSTSTFLLWLGFMKECAFNSS